jgi:hypothetical protein
MEMLIVRVTTSILPITLFLLFAGPDLPLEDKIRNALIPFKLFKDDITVDSILRVVGQVYG